MTPRVAWLALVLLGATYRVVASDGADDVQDAVYFHSDRPLFLRLHVRLNDRGYRSAWRQAIEQLFRYFDTDDNGVVTPEEMNRGGWMERMSNVSSSGSPSRGGARLRPAHTADELADALRPVLAPLTLQQSSQSVDGAENLFARLDRDGDQTLSRSELDTAAGTLNPLDRDSDEMIVPIELAHSGGPFSRKQPPPPRPADPGAAPLLLISPHEPHARLAARLIQRYDLASRENPREPDHKLAHFEIGMGEAAFRRADADGDGALDHVELSRYLDHPEADLEVSINIGLGKGAETTISAHAIDDSSPFLARRLRPISPGRFDLHDDRVAVEFSPRPVFSRTGFDIRENFQIQFSAADADGNNIVDREEVERTGYFRESFDLMDRDHDGKLTAREALALVDLALELAHSGVLVLVTDESHALFDALDANHDRRLGPRELRSASQQLSCCDMDRDGRLAERELPQHLRVTFDHAPGAFSIGPQLDLFAMDVNPANAGGRAPNWFANMDVNHDGDLSPREFLGTAAAFRRLDRDGDGLIDASEAAQAVASTR